MSDFTLAWHGREFFQLATKETVKAMETAGRFVENRAKKIMGSGASKFNVHGNTKSARGKSGKKTFHRPSAPGFPPAVDEGILRTSVSHVTKVKGLTVNGFVGSDKDKIKAKAEAGTDVEYGFYLEVGTKNMEARPWLRPALRASEKGILNILRGGVEEFKGRPDFSSFVGPTNQ